MKILSRQATWPDYLLATLASVLAVYSTAMGIGQPKIGYFFGLGIVVGSLISFALGKILQDKPLIKFDGILYASMAIISIVWARPLNGLLPEGGYTFQLMIGGLLSWMLMLGSFATWRDYSLLFQAVPSIALFGLCGVWDTFKGATILFFGFLLCTATLFARAHARGMLGQAIDAGILGRRTKTKKLSPEEESSAEAQAANRLAEGPWRWMAGPEWALASAAAIVFVSVVGAPLFQQSLQSVAGSVRIALPAPPTSTPFSRTFSGGQNSLPIGQGPRRLRGIDLLKLKIDKPRYMRGTIFDTYTGKGWTRDYSKYFLNKGSSVAWLAQNSNRKPYDSRDIIKDFEEVPFEIIPLAGFHDKLYFPGEPYRLPTDRQYQVLIDGTVAPSGILEFDKAYNAAAIAPVAEMVPKNAGNPLAHVFDWVPTTTGKAAFVDTTSISPKVRQLALDVTRGAATDYDKAQAIKREIESRVRYNLDALPVPDNVDPVEYFLFQSKEGYCDLFASSMALMARSAGLPARVATGFIVTDPTRDEKGFFTLHDSDYHAWAEIYFEGVGWVPFDPTEGAPEVGGLPKNGRAWYQAVWFQVLLDVVLGVIVLSGLGLLVRAAIGKRSPTVKAPNNEIGRLYRRFERDIERRVRSPRRLSQTPIEYCEKSAERLGEASVMAATLAEKFEEAFYSSPEPSQESIQELSAAVRTFQKLPKPKRQGGHEA